MDIYEIRNELAIGKSIYDLRLRVTYYTRVSTHMEHQQNSLEAQIDYFPKYIKNVPNWILVDGYVDEGSGMSTINRNDFNRMIEDAEDHKFDLIITKEVSRFARNTLDSLYYTRELLKYGVGVLFEIDNINTLLPDSELRLTIMSSMAQEESRKLSERVKWGHKRATQRGTVYGNNRMWGYDKDNGTLVINEKEAEMVRLIFDLYANHNLGFRKVADRLTELGYYNRNGNPFTYNSIKGIITNPKYKGYFVGNKTATVDYLTKERILLDKDEWIIYKDETGNVPAIVDEQLWNKANAVLKKRSMKMSTEDKTSYQNKYLYSGKIICGKHKTTYWRNIYRYKTIDDKELWQCKIYRTGGSNACSSPMLYRHELDFILSNILNHIWQDKEGYIDKLMGVYESIINDVDYEKDIKELMRQITMIGDRKNKLLDLSLDGLIDNNEFKKRNDTFNVQIETLEKQIAKYESLNDSKKDNQQQIKYFQQIFENDINFQKDFDEIKARQILDKIIVYETKVKDVAYLEIFLKSGIEIPTFFKKQHDMRLSPSLHSVCDKRTFSFTRYINQKHIQGFNIKVNVNTFFSF